MMGGSSGLRSAGLSQLVDCASAPGSAPARAKHASNAAVGKRMGFSRFGLVPWRNLQKFGSVHNPSTPRRRIFALASWHRYRRAGMETEHNLRSADLTGNTT